jgi:ubiquinone/menaquinone biosynthesis C-methylase UbiE
MKLAGFRARHADAAVQGDATQLPFADGCADAIACTLMSHHLTDAQLAAMMDEVKRVLKPAGTFLFADPLWAPARLPGRLLWRYDRGAHPRDANTLRDVIAARLRIERWEEFALWHRYAVCLARGSDL